jgi:aspartokinase
MSLIVQKYGGTSVADIEKIHNVAKRVAKTYEKGNDIVVILSAMAGVTDDLIEMEDANWMFCWLPVNRRPRPCWPSHCRP